MDQYIGRLLDNRYEILEIIGTGGMAVVYKARCHRLNRLVAIKILKDEFSRDEEFRRRFHAEGEAVAMLSHPNIVQVFDVSTSESANFIVMELIDGIIGSIVHQNSDQALGILGDIHTPGGVTAVMVGKVLALQIHIGGGVGTPDLQIILVCLGQFLHLLQVAAGSPEIVIAAVLTVHRVPAMGQIHGLGSLRNRTGHRIHILDKCPVLVNVQNSSHVPSSFL